MQLHICGIKPFLNLSGIEYVTGERKARILAYTRAEDKARCLAAGLLLRMVCGVTGESMVRYGANGKPYRRDGGGFFNLSHAGDYVVLGTAGSEIGMDIEKIDSYSMGVATRCFTPPELAWLSRESGNEAFYRLWTGKESVMKGIGLGLSLAPEDFCILPMDRSAHRIASRTWFLDWLSYDGHIVCIAIENKTEETRLVPVSASDLCRGVIFSPNNGA